MRTLVMTGGTRGLGRHVVEKVLARPDWRVLLLGRPAPASLAPELRPHPRLEMIEADLADLRSVDGACGEVLQRMGGARIAALSLNAGVQHSQGDMASHDGFEIHFAVNHLAHALIADRLAPHVERGGRIVVTSSVVHDPTAFCIIGISRATWQDPYLLADPARSQSHVRWQVNRGESRYSASKLCNVMLARALARDLPDLAVVSFNPSVVPGTGIARERSAFQRFLWSSVAPPLSGILPGMRHVDVSSSDLAWLLLDADLSAASGGYYDGRNLSPGSPESRDGVKIDRLMLVTRELIGTVLGRERLFAIA
ncbi:MAG: SDR family NAD(P)-dependent oxidoreductase [Hyphomicrobiaceae bacterium]|nr:SDR family NAD(P)-dependent oxidoreductase [Hyphomicrobiaceae bacterium]